MSAKLKNCSYSNWSSWSVCSSDCIINGLRYRSRNASSADTTICSDKVLETESCISDCNCETSQWSDWSACSLPCGSGISRKTRKLSTPNKYCNTTLEELKLCNTQCCQLDGRWSSWSSWSVCSATCDNGLRKRTRACDNPKPDCGGVACNGSSVEYEVCVNKPCKTAICASDKVFSNCSNSCDTWCPVLSCTEQCRKPDTCIPGCICPFGLTQNQDKQCVKPHECICKYNNNDVAPGQIIKNNCETCQCIAGCMKCSPTNCTDCKLSSWSEWSICINGSSKRFRNFNRASCNSSDAKEETRACENLKCSINGANYSNGTSFTNPLNKCEDCKCDKGGLICRNVCLETKKSCEEKSNNNYTFVWSEPKGEECCGTCTQTVKKEDCSVSKLNPDYIVTSTGCISQVIQEREVCIGSCQSYESNYVRINGTNVNGEKLCTCCSADKTYVQKIKMICGLDIVDADYIRISTCKRDKM